MAANIFGREEEQLKLVGGTFEGLLTSAIVMAFTLVPGRFYHRKHLAVTATSSCRVHSATELLSAPPSASSPPLVHVTQFRSCASCTWQSCAPGRVPQGQDGPPGSLTHEAERAVSSRSRRHLRSCRKTHSVGPTCSGLSSTSAPPRFKSAAPCAQVADLPRRAPSNAKQDRGHQQNINALSEVHPHQYGKYTSCCVWRTSCPPSKRIDARATPSLHVPALSWM